MILIVYIDEVIILNFIIDYIILNITSKLLKLNIKKKRIIYSCLFGELSIIYLFVNFNNFFLLIFKLILGIFMVLISFGFNDIKTLIKNTIYFYIFSFFLGGTLYYFKIENIINYKYYLLIIPFIMDTYEYFMKDLKNIITTKYKVSIYLKNGKVLFFNGFMDTGNILKDPITNKKIIIINKYINENYCLVPYKTIDNSSMLKCFKPKKVYIDGIGERNDILVGVVNKKFIGFNCLLNYGILEEK